MTDNSNNNSEHNNNGSDTHDLDKDLGIAGGIAQAFINSPVTPLLMMAALAIGLLGLFFTPRQEDPKISVPMVDIFVQYSGASAEQVASLVTDPLERIMSEIPGVRHVYSATRRGDAIVTVRFLVGEDLGDSIVKVHDKLQSNLDKIPPGVSPPLVKPIGIDDVPVVTATLWSNNVDDGILRALSLDVLQKLKEVPNTGKGFIVGGRSEQIRVEISPERLSGFGVSLAQVANTIKTANAEQAAGTVEGGNTSFDVYTGAFLRNAQEISNLVVGIRDGTPVYVRDVATVTQQPEETKQITSYFTGKAEENSDRVGNGAPAVTIALSKKINTNGVTVARDIIDRIESLKGDLIPDNIHVDITRNYGKTADDKVNELLKALFEAAVIVSILCLIGLGMRAASVVITIIPVVILITVWSAWVLDYTIDRVSLFALVFSIGILVDDATVVVENIFRRWLAAGKTTVDIAIDAVREVGNPTILATLTIICAMLPMGFVSGLMGPYMRPIPVLGASAMFFSLIAAFVFAPWFAMRVRPQMQALEKAEKREAKTAEWIGKFYNPCMKPLCENRKIGKIFLLVLIVATFLACSLFYFKIVTVKMLPFDNKPEFNVVINMPEGTALPVTANVTSQMAEELRNIPEVTALQTYAGIASPFNFNGMVRHYFLRQQPWEADIQVMLLDKNARERGSHEIAVDARHLLTKLINNSPDLMDKGVRIQVVEMPPGPPVLQTVVTEIYGPDAETRRQVAMDMTRIFEQADGVVDVDNYITDPYEYWRFKVDTEKAVRRGISVDNINQNLAMAMGGYKLGDVKRGVVLEPTYIIIQVALHNRSQISRLKNLPIQGTNGQVVPLAELGEFIKEQQEPIIYHKDLRSIEYVVGEMEGRLGAPIYGMFAVEDLLENYTTPDNVKITGMPMGLLGPPDSDDVSGFEWTGEWTVTYETFRDMGMAFMAALLLIYALIVWEFKNFTIGGLIMAPIPLTLIGIIPGHGLTGAEFTATSMIGFIALAGIIVRNSILLVEFVKHEVSAGKPIREAVVDAGRIRMRPIFITALTLMAGAFAIIGDPIFQGMAVSLLFGTAIATVLTLVVIPLGCISARKQFYLLTGTTEMHAEAEKALEQEQGYKTPLLLSIWSKLVTVLIWVFYILRAIYFLVSPFVIKLWNWLMSFRSKPEKPDTPSGPYSGSGGSSPSPTTSGGGSAAASKAAVTPENFVNKVSTSGPASKSGSKASPKVAKKVVKAVSDKSLKKAAPKKVKTSIKKPPVKSKPESNKATTRKPALQKKKVAVKKASKPALQKKKVAVKKARKTEEETPVKEKNNPAEETAATVKAKQETEKPAASKKRRGIKLRQFD